MNIGHRIKRLREQIQMTQEELGNIIGVNKATVNRYETGVIDIKRTVAIKLAEALHTTPAYLMGWEDSPEESNLAFKDRINEVLEIRKMKAADLAKLSGVNEGAISQYRTGAYKATQRTLDKLSKALNVSVPWLMGYDVPMDRKIADSFTPHEQTVITQYRAKPHLQEAVDKLLDVPTETLPLSDEIQKDIAQELESISATAKSNIPK